MSKKEIRIRKGKEIEGVVLPQASPLASIPPDYHDFISKIKEQIATQRIKSMLNANSELILLYWHIGKAIMDKQQLEGWGAKVIDRMSYDLKEAFPEMSGFSPRNLKYMRKFAQAWSNIEIVQRTVAQIPWRSNITLLDKLEDTNVRLWYAQKVLEYGMGKDMLVFQIESSLHKREGATVSNFEQTLPPLSSDLTQQTFKDPYIFDFLGTDIPRREKELEQKLIDHIQKFLLELGQGFAFVGRQVHIEFDKSDYYIDLLFYHLSLRCFVVIELKAGEFKPEFISKLNFYQNIVNDVLKHPTDNPTLGLLLVKEKNKLLVEYSLMNNQNPTGVANWENLIVKNLPDNFKNSLPSVEEIESELSKDSMD
jgi:predicted nuclease of restriction endonuclease-like (RecB) superfamily